MNRIKMAGGMLLGAVLLQLGFMACSAQNTSGIMAKFFDGGAQGGDTGVMGGRDARAQEMPCTQWEVQRVQFGGGDSTMIAAGWEPFGVVYVGATGASMIATRRCTTH
ncbi:MAG: hypothetical protein JWM10_1920 [Myxococcaceae bacterium]|nr:hypothetical protein [Myxococcaceae bacterium]